MVLIPTLMMIKLKKRSQRSSTPMVLKSRRMLIQKTIFVNTSLKKETMLVLTTLHQAKNKWQRSLRCKENKTLVSLEE